MFTFLFMFIHFTSTAIFIFFAFDSFCFDRNNRRVYGLMIATVGFMFRMYNDYISAILLVVGLIVTISYFYTKDEEKILSHY